MTGEQTSTGGNYNQAVTQLEIARQNIRNKSSYLKSYVLSVLLPPIGIYYFIKFFFLGDADNGRRRAGVVNLTLTIISLVVNIWLLFAAFGQISTVTSNDSNQNTQFLKELITPENQKSLQQLLQ